MQIFLVISLLIAIFAIVFALQNTAAVTITFIAWTFHGSLALVLILSVLAGILTGLLAMLPAVVRSRLRVSSHRKESAALKSSLAEHQQKMQELQQQIQHTSGAKETETPEKS
jgi:putative membrane protein